MNREIRIVVAYSPRLAAVLTASALVLGSARDLASESLTLSTTYPSPSGIYNSLITTGGSAVNNNTTLNTQGGNTLLTPNASNPNGWVGVGATAATADPRGAKLVLGGNADMNGSEIINLQLTPLNPADAASKAYVDAKTSGGPGSWTCVVRSASAATVVNVLCNAGEQVISGGCSNANATFSTNAPTIAQPGWQCATINSSIVTAFANCCQ